MTATPPRADLRTLAAEAVRDARHRFATAEQIADAVLAAVLPKHRRMVLGEAAEALDVFPLTGASTKYGQTARRWFDQAAETIRRLAAAAPPAGLSAPVPAENAPAVPEEADGQRAAGADALTYAEMEAERDRLAGEVFTLTNSEGLAVVAAELERDEARADRDRLAAQVGQFQDVVEAAKAWRDAVRDAPDDDDWHWEDDPYLTIAHSLYAAVGTLPDAGTDQTEGDRGV